jgi:hypothetical protein
VLTVLLANLAFFAINVAWPAPPSEPERLVRANPPGENVGIHETQEVVSAALTQYRDGTLAPDRCLCVLFGISGAQFGLRLETLRERDLGDCLYLGLCFAGKNLSSTAAVAEVVLASELRPKVAVFAISPFQLRLEGELVDGAPRLETNTSELEEYWLHEQRGEIRKLSDALLASVRKQMLQFIHGRTASKQVDPWREMAAEDLGAEFNAREGAEVLAFYRQRGYFDPGAYQPDMDGVRLLIRLIQKFHAKGVQVIVAWNPEHSRLRQRLPAAATLTIEAALNDAFQLDPVPILDFRDALADHEFYDVVHPNTRGRESYSRVFAERISQFLYKAPSAAGAR